MVNEYQAQTKRWLKWLKLRNNLIKSYKSLKNISKYTFLYKQPDCRKPGLTCPKFKQLLGPSCLSVTNCDKQLTILWDAEK